MADPNIPNLDKLIAHLEAQPPERINMAWVEIKARRDCGTCGCIAGHILFMQGRANSFAPVTDMGAFLGIAYDDAELLAEPDGFFDEIDGVVRYPARRVIATLKRLRDRFLATGEIVVDWGPEPTAKEPWTAPQAVELTPPALPAEITRLLSAERETAGGV